MKKGLLTTLMLFVLQLVVAQDIDISKEGLVTVDGKAAFYLVKKKKNFLQNDVVLQNLDKQELAYLSQREVDELPYNERSNAQGTYFLLAFSETGNTANVMPEIPLMKNLARQMINARLVNGNKIDPKAEKAFVATHHGKVFRDPETIQITVNTAPAPPTKGAEITIKGSNIYSNDELIGSFKQSLAEGVTTVAVYNKSDAKIASAIHPENNADADWELMSASDGKKFQVLYNSSNPLEKLFKFLADKGYF